MPITVLHNDIIKQSLFNLNYKKSIIQSFICYAQLFHTHRHTPMHAHTFILQTNKPAPPFVSYKTFTIMK